MIVAGTGSRVPAIDFGSYLIPMKYVPGVGTVNDAPVRRRVLRPVRPSRAVAGVEPAQPWWIWNSAALFVLLFDWVTVTTWFGVVVVIFVQKKNLPGLIPWPIFPAGTPGS